MRRLLVLCVIFFAGIGAAPFAHAGGPFGIDHTVPYDNSGIWARSNQKALIGVTIAGVIGGSLVLGDQDKLGDTFWRSLDSMAVSSAVAEGGKLIFQRERPSETDNPNEFFKGTQYQSFPSGEVSAIAGAVTPFVVAYGHDHPAVYALELLPLYDSIARVKVHGHWQSDVLVGWAIGTGAGIWAEHRQSPLILGWLPHGFTIGIVHHFKS
ncbi:MAG TPA: phosphatase PAP2 family protein [Rhodanobacteraceae bacterium]|nr:phosphatase PAP2 family protein [Rhodanobacteraceae bacterium]